MKIAMNLLLWSGTLTEEHLPLLDKMAAIGFDGVELPMYDLTASPWQAIARRCDDLGLGRNADTIVQDDFCLVSDDPAVRQRGVDFLRGALDLCASIGVDILAGPFVTPVGKLVGRGRTPDEWNRAVDCLIPVAQHAKKVGVKLSYEPLNRFESYFCNTAEDATRLVQAVGVDSFGLLFDTFHANIEELDLPAAVRAAGPAINHFHISNNDRSTPGTGHIPFKAVAAALADIGYDDWATIEAFGQSLPELAAATCIWRRMYDTEEQLATDGLAFSRSLF
jgi:D-psicose/D-tagatose/L-ribulose 3-epimerase